MRTSNIIIIAFFTLILGGILFLFIHAKVTKPEGIRENRKTTEHSLSDFHVIVADSAANFTVEQSNRNVILVLTPEGKQVSQVFFLERNDTLFVNKALSSDQIIVNCSSLTTVIARNESRINLNNPESESFLIDTDNSKMWIKTKQSDTEKNPVFFVSARNNSMLEFYDIHTKGVDLQMDRSKINLYSTKRIESLKAQLENESQLRCYNSKNIFNIKIGKDVTSSSEIFK